MTFEVPVDSDDAHAAWSCRRKKQYPSQEIAEKIASQINEVSDAVVRSYGCRHCGQWHVGTAPGERRTEVIRPRKASRRVYKARPAGGSYESARRRSKRARYQNHEEEDD